jgi:hypothetical protein
VNVGVGVGDVLTTNETRERTNYWPCGYVAHANTVAATNAP